MPFYSILYISLHIASIVFSVIAWWFDARLVIIGISRVYLQSFQDAGLMAWLVGEALLSLHPLSRELGLVATCVLSLRLVASVPYAMQCGGIGVLQLVVLGLVVATAICGIVERIRRGE